LALKPNTFLCERFDAFSLPSANFTSHRAAL
jgi:hypothetical protein